MDGGEGGIRTHTPFKTDGFQDRGHYPDSFDLPLRILYLNYFNMKWSRWHGLEPASIIMPDQGHCYP